MLAFLYCLNLKISKKISVKSISSMQNGSGFLGNAKTVYFYGQLTSGLDPRSIPHKQELSSV